MKNSANKRRLLGLLLFIILGGTLYALFFQSFIVIPSYYRVNVGEQIAFGNILPQQISSKIAAYVLEGKANLKWRKDIISANSFRPFGEESPIAVVPGHVDLDLRLFGIVPLKRITLQVIPPVKVMAGGHSIGVLFHSRGVLVIGYAEIVSPSGESSCPAREAGILPGDIILKIENIDVQSDTQVSFLIDQLARKKDVLRFQVKRKEHIEEYNLRPVFCNETKRYRVGLYIRDGAAGVGTLTFFDPDTKKYGALGHMITSSDKNERLDLADGEIVSASVLSIKKAERGRIGEKVGLFLSSEKTRGSVDKNTKYGIYGRLKMNLVNPLFPKPIPVAMCHQVKKGPAELLTVIDGEQISSFKVEIQTVFARPRQDGKAFIIKITDPELLSRTGGIVQGMSGSPIIQKGKLVGAVTHVFINDPTLGYGVLAESMLEEAGLLPVARQVVPGFSCLFLNIMDDFKRNISIIT